MEETINQKLLSYLKEFQLVDASVLQDAVTESQSAQIPLVDILLKRDAIAEDNLGKVLADIYNLPFIKLSQTPIPDQVLKIIPEVVARKQRIIAFNLDKTGLHVAMEHPEQKTILELLSKKTEYPVHVYLAMNRDIENTLSLYRKDIQTVFDTLITQQVHHANQSQNKEPSIIQIVDTIITYAYENNTSDIHIEPYGTNLLIRFRIDGVLHDIIKLPLVLHEQIVSRIKVLANLKTDEHSAPQDGKLQWKPEQLDTTSQEKLDIRVSVVPIMGGEKVVMRLLSERSRQFSLQDLGFSTDDFKKLETAYKKPYGMILATGPTGSGKTTTLYAILKMINKRGVNIMTIEDPIEYDMAGVNQIQVNQTGGLTFAKGLRSIVRQDPDIILVGEIRDEETADIAINSAMTGHLVLSTLHTNDAATTIPRFLNMKIEPFLIASTINIVIAQRLVRKICQNCRVSSTDSLEALSRQLPADLLSTHFGKKETIRTYKGKGCDVCHTSGYLGRVGVFEVMLLDNKIRDAIIQKKDSATIKQIAVTNGMQTMIDDALEKVKQGITTIEEVLRVVYEM